MLKKFKDWAKSRVDSSGVALVTVIAVFAVCSILAVSITSTVLFTTGQEASRAKNGQAYLTAKSVLAVTKNHIESISGNSAELYEFAGKTASGRLPDMGDYTVTITWSDENELAITSRGEFMGHASELYAIVDVSGSGAP